jgi:hypothetical protein
MEEYKIIEPKTSEYLSGLNKEQLDEVVAMYNKKEVKISDIIQRYNLERIFVGSFRKHLPSSICKEYVCPACLVYSWVKPIGRGEQSIPFCPSCHTDMYSNYEAIKKQRKKTLKLQGGDITNYLISKEQFYNLDFESKVFIAAMVSSCLSDNVHTVQRWRIQNMKFYPLPELQREMMHHLNFINDNSNKVNIEVEEELVTSLQNSRDIITGTVQERYELWKKLALAEATELFTYEMHECGFFEYHGEEVELVLYSFLEDYSVAQTYNIIWRSVRKATTVYSRIENKNFAASTVLNHCQKFVAIKKHKGETIDRYNRPPYCTQSKMSQYYFDLVLKIGEDGFNKPPSPNYLIM